MDVSRHRMNREVRLEGPGVFLRPVRIEDVGAAYHGWMNDPEVNRHMETRFRPQTPEAIQEYVKKTTEDPVTLFLAVIDRKDRRHVGNIKLGPVNWNHGRAELSFFLGERDRWGRGLTTEAVRLVTDYGLEVLGLHKITAGCYSANPGSRRVFEKAAFELEAVLKAHYLDGNTWVDRLCFCRFQEDPGNHAAISG